MTRAGFVHQALRYGTDAEFLAGTLDYAREGLAEGDAVFAVVQERNIRLLEEALGPDAAGDVDFTDARDWYHFPSRTLGRYHAYCKEHENGGSRRVRIIGEPVWTGRTELETREWMRYESLLNVAFADSGHWIVCPYDTRTLSEDVLGTAARTHPELTLGPGEWANSERFSEPADLYAEFDDEELLPPGAPVHELALTRGDSVTARLAAAEFATRCGMAEDRVHEVVAALHESALNALRYGGGHAVVRLWTESPFLVCEVTDNGVHAPARDARPAYAGHLPPEPRASSGHGMWVARQLSDLLEERLRPAGSVVRMHFRL